MVPLTIKANKANAMMAIISFWCVIALINLSQNYLSSQVRNWDFKWSEQLIYSSNWILWVVFTPVIFVIAKRIEAKKYHLPRFILLNIFVALLFALSICLLEIGLQFSLWFNFIDKDIFISDFYGALFYRYHLNLFIFLFVSGVFYWYFFLSKSSQLEWEKSNLSNQLAHAQLTNLKMQLQPHFLFNTHHAIIGLMLNQNNEMAIKMLTKLSDLLRKSMDNTDQQLVPVKNELLMLNDYLDIHKLRFGNRLEIQVQVDKDLQEAMIPALLLQPLVENAIKHGIARYSDACHLAVLIKSYNDQLLIEINDDGPGIHGQIIEGIGIKNTRERLSQLYGSNYSLEFINLEPRGLSVQLVLPLKN